jgi:uncharacterized membrane protein YdbT with pleckstrin-like domain
MGYVRDNVMPGERVVFETQLHWIVYGPAVAIALVSIMVGTAMGAEDGIIVAIMGIFIAMLSAGATWVRRRTSEFAVTDRRVLVKTGLIARKTLELQVDRIESLSIDQPILGRMLGYGTVRIRGMGAGEQPFPSVAQAMDLRKHVYEQAEKPKQPHGAM